MTEDEREARAWLDKVAAMKHASFGDVYTSSECARTIQRMLARPVMPETPSGEALNVIYQTMFDPGPNRSGAIYRALYAHLSRPAKEVEIDRWFIASADSGHLYGYVSEDSARRDVHAWDAARPKEGPHVVIRLTGKATVPA